MRRWKTERVELRAKGGERLVECVARRAGSKKRAKRLIDEGLVSVNGQKELLARRRLKGGEVVRFPLTEAPFKPPNVKLLFRERGVWVFEKPPFITTNEGEKSLEETVRKLFNPNLKVVHRLDKQTTGPVIAVESGKLFEAFKEQFKRREVKKEYLCLVKGKLRSRQTVRRPIDGKSAVSLVTPLEHFKRATLCRVEIETGRKHQIRRHLASVGYPVVGEFLYYRGSWPEELLFCPRIALHFRKLSFTHPATGKRITVESELPKDLKEFIGELER
ncbi:RluA family pseudouridine synthase [Thermovibrio ammonificans]